MATAAVKHFSTVEYIKKLREANFTEAQADVVAEIIEQHAQIIQEQSSKLAQLESKDLSTKGDIYEVKQEIKMLEVKIEQYRYDSLKFIVWTGIAVVIALGGMLAKGFHWL